MRPASPARYLFRKYLDRAARAICSSDYEVEVSVGRSASEIPYPYVLDGTDDLRLDGAQAADLAMLVPDHRARPYRRRGRRRRLAADAGRGAAAVAVRRPARRFQPGAAAPLYRHPGPSTPSATSCSPTMSATSTSSSAGRSRSCRPRTAPIEALSAAGGVYVTKDTPDAVAAGRRGRLAPAPDAGLSSDRAQRRGHHPRQYRRRPVQRQDDLRPSRGDAARGLADDRPLRRPAPQPDDRRLCPRPRLSARRPCHGRRAADRGADPGHRRGPAGAVRRRRSRSPARSRRT